MSPPRGRRRLVQRNDAWAALHADTSTHPRNRRAVEPEEATCRRVWGADACASAPHTMPAIPEEVSAHRRQHIREGAAIVAREAQRGLLALALDVDDDDLTGLDVTEQNLL